MTHRSARPWRLALAPALLFGGLAHAQQPAEDGPQQAVDSEAPPPAETGAPPAAAGPPPAEAKPWDRFGFGWGGVPAVAYNSDDGFGYGVLASVYRYDGGTAPYKWSSTILLYMTTKQVHTHRIDLDVIEVADLPLRLSTRVEFASTRAANYCGTDPSQPCDLAEAEALAASMGLEGKAADELVDRYHKVRLIQPNGLISARYAIDPMPHKVELMLAWWGQYLIPGDFDVREPYPDTLYAADFPGGEEGFSSVLQTGVMVDNRDNEPAPKEGYWVEATVRGGAPVWGSDWSWFGYNTTLRGYAPFDKRARLIGAARLVADGVVGELPFLDETRMGGSQIYESFGGQRSGRGVRLRGVAGKVRFIAQPELRWTFSSFKVSKAKVDLTAIGFSDVGWLAQDWQNLDNSALVVTEGVGMRWAFNTNFIIRTDVGFSSREDFAPGVYIDIGNLW
ncbi:MAG: BamA/TamA family outer membrane protein [Deltaproteobacteria bacterium]|nr:BamA/TamA family outer membrane protein [Deltaproteobacteria bacterium]